VPTNLNSFETVLKWCPYGAVIVADGRISAANAEAVAIFGVGANALVGMPLERLVAAEHRAAVAGLVRDAASVAAKLDARLAHDLQPIELAVSSGADQNATLLIGVRSMAREYRLSAVAHAELTHDPTTGLPSRLHLLSQINERVRGHRARPLALVGLWIDNLGGLADERGDHAVSRVLREVSARLQGRLRGPDLLGRLDQSGFLTVLTSDTNVEQLKEIGGRLRDEVAFPVEFNDSLVSFTASVAVASIGFDRPTLDELVAGIDEVSARARDGKGNQTEVFSFASSESKQ